MRSPERIPVFAAAADAANMKKFVPGPRAESPVQINREETR